MQITRDMTQRPGVGTLMYMGEDPPLRAELAGRKTQIIAGGAALWALGGFVGAPKVLRTAGGIAALAAYFAL